MEFVIADQRRISPTALADVLILCFHNFLGSRRSCKELIGR